MLNQTTKQNQPNSLQASLRLMLVLMSFALCVAIAPAQAADDNTQQSQAGATTTQQAPVGEIIEDMKKYLDQEPISGDSSQDYGDQCDTPITGG